MNYFSVIGLSFDIAGTVMIFYFGLPSKIVSTETTFIAEKPDAKAEKIEKRNKKVQCIAKVGLFFIILGFIFQLMGVIVPPNNNQDYAREYYYKPY